MPLVAVWRYVQHAYEANGTTFTFELTRSMYGEYHTTQLRADIVCAIEGEVSQSSPAVHK